jgi:hypothetical protein
MGYCWMTAEIVSLADYRLARGRTPVISAAGVLCLQRSIQEGLGISGLVSRQDDRWKDHRLERRFVLIGKCAVAIAVNGRPTRLLNVSRTGLMAAVSRSATPGSRVLLAVAGCSPLSALVIWSREGAMGLEVPLELAGL